MRSFLLILLSALSCLAVTVPVAIPAKGTIHRWITIPSLLEANQHAILHAKVAGHLKTIAVDAGDAVKAGQELAVLEVPELEADRIKAVAEVEVAGSDLRRLQAARAKAPGLEIGRAHV